MAKFQLGDLILQVSGEPNTVCYTAYDKGPSKAHVIKITPKMYQLRFFNEEMHSVRIEDIDRDFVRYTTGREEELVQIYTEMRTSWSKLYQKQIDFLREDK